eukprot:scaffold39514_cov27-Prasinocladus_malaysianus.AAC.2
MAWQVASVAGSEQQCGPSGRSDDRCAGPQVAGRSHGLAWSWKMASRALGLLESAKVLHRGLCLRQTLLVVRPDGLQLNRHVADDHECAQRRRLGA